MDSVKFQALERAELGDLLALQGLTYEHIKRALGQLIGSPTHSGDTGAGGLLAQPSLTYNHSTGTLSLSSFSYLELTRGGATISNGQTATPEARVIRFDSGASGHTNHPIDISAHRVNQGIYALYARATTIDEDVSARRAWSISQNTEISITIPTRERERVEFTPRAAADGAPTDSGGFKWVLLFTYFVNNGALSVATYNHALSAADSEIQAIYGVSLGKTSLDGELDAITSQQSATYGLIQHLAHVRALLFQIISEGTGDTSAPPVANRWSTPPALSLRQLAANLTSTNNDLAALDTRVTNEELSHEAQKFNAHLQLHARITFDPNTNAAQLNKRVVCSDPDTNAKIVDLFFDRQRNPTEAGTFDGQTPFTSVESFLDVLSRPVLSFHVTNPLNAAHILSENIHALGQDSNPDAFGPTGSTSYSDSITWRPYVDGALDPLDSTYPDSNALRIGPKSFTLIGGGTSTDPNARAYELIMDNLRARPLVTPPAANSAGNYVFYFIFSLELSNRSAF